MSTQTLSPRTRSLRGSHTLRTHTPPNRHTYTGRAHIRGCGTRARVVTDASGGKDQIDTLLDLDPGKLSFLFGDRDEDFALSH